MKSFVTALGMCALMACTVVIADVTWEGDYSSYWDVQANWVGGTLPTSTSDVVVDSNNPNWPQLYTDQEIASLDLDNGAQLNMNNGSTDRTLTVDGDIEIKSGGATLGGSGGNVIAESWTFTGQAVLNEGTYRCQTVE